MKRKDVTKIRKIGYLMMALRERELKPDIKSKTDIIGIAIQYSSNPKLKREDFDDILDMKFRDFVL